MKILSKPNDQLSRKVKVKDYQRVADCIEPMTKLCFERLGLHAGALALAHCQVEENDHLRFYVAKEGFAIVNPQLEVGGKMVKSFEGCMTFPNKKGVNVERYKSGYATYTKMTTSRTGSPRVVRIKRQKISGKMCMIMQHEIAHFNCKTIFD